MEQKRKQLLLKTVRGNYFRRALKAIAELRASSDGSLTSAGAQTAAPDEQRKFQLCVANVVLQKGIKGLVDDWATLVELITHDEAPNLFLGMSTSSFKTNLQCINT